MNSGVWGRCFDFSNVTVKTVGACGEGRATLQAEPDGRTRDFAISFA